MRKFVVWMVMVVMVAFSANFAFAGNASVDGDNGVAIGIDNNNTNNNTANANANASANQQQQQNQNQNQQQKLVNNFVVPIQPYSFDAPMPMSAGQAAANSAWMLYMPVVLDCLTIEEATGMTDFFWNRIEVSLKVRGLAATSSIRILDYYGKKPGDKVVGFARVFGKKRDINESLVALAAEHGMRSGATGMSIMIRVKNRTNAKGLSIGAGAGAGLYVPCNNGVGTGLSFGAYLSSVAIEDEIELTVLYLVVGPPQPCPPKVEPPPPAPPEVKKPCPPPCDWTRFKIQIEIWREACTHCKLPCLNNGYLRFNMGTAYIDWYECAGKADKNLLIEAIKEYDRAERDILNGKEPDGTRTRTLEGAQALLYKVRYNKSFAIRELYGKEAQLAYARNNGLTAVPDCYAELKR